MEATFILEEKPRWVKGSRIPDVMYYTRERNEELEASPNWQKYPATVVPNIVVEVVSPSDDAESLVEKAALYLEDGVEAVWLVWMDDKRVDIYTPDSDVPQVIQGDNAILSGAPLLPQFELPLSQLFSK
jgi:Uma2 family endonuclease